MYIPAIHRISISPSGASIKLRNLPPSMMIPSDILNPIGKPGRKVF
jgi:hypothetical protein